MSRIRTTSTHGHPLRVRAVATTGADRRPPRRPRRCRPTAPAPHRVGGSSTTRSGRPRPGPAAHLQQRGEHPGGEAPDEHPAHLERRPDPAARMADPQPVGRVDQLGDRQPGDVRHLGRLARVHRVRRVPPGQHRGHHEVADRDPQLRQLREHGRRWPGRDRPPPSASRSAVAAGVGVVRVGRAAREGRLAGVVAQRRGALQDQHVRLAGPAARRAAPAPRWPGRRRSGVGQPGEVFGPARRDPGQQRLPPGRQAVRSALTAHGHRHAEVLRGQRVEGGRRRAPSAL